MDINTLWLYSMNMCNSYKSQLVILLYMINSFHQ